MLAMAVTVEAEGEAHFISGVMAFSEHRALSMYSFIDLFILGVVAFVRT